MPWSAFSYAQKALGNHKEGNPKKKLLGVTKWQADSEWTLPTFIIPKKDNTVRVVRDFRELNKQIVRKPFPIPKISTILQELEGFTYSTALDLNMGHFTIGLDPDASRLCTIILLWGKYA